MNKLSKIAVSIGRSTSSGVGFAIGRDIYKTTKRNFTNLLVILIILGFLTLPFVGFRNLVRGYDRSSFSTLFITIIWNLIIIATGIGLGALVVPFLTIPWTISGNSDHNMQVFMYGLMTIGGISSFAGLIVGLIQRSARKKCFQLFAPTIIL